MPPPISGLTTPYAPAAPSRYACDAALTPCLILSAAYHPNAHLVPSRHASDASYHPYAHIVPSRHASNSTLHPYACRPQDVTPMQPPISTLTTPYASAPPPLTILMLLQHPQPSLYLILSAAYPPYAQVSYT
ncbi:hypothetical protein O181_036908 [Austropuccinia psidii MF-1]|uniref:Uncharacterized protein n=1 Tax=Austropuccinia psidii MF-1 TaxID=1389203 RepID=A0A9Q3D8C0_9BASI|nr:hypothetical protein [Austropuccinia psidii MF-1]